MNIERQNSETTTRTTRSTSSTSGTRRTGSSSTTTTVATEPGVSCNWAEVNYVWQQIMNAYCQTINADMSMQVAHMIADYMRYGIEPEVIVEAINETGFAARPSPQYLRAILRRCTNQSIHTMEQWRNAQWEREEQMTKASKARFDAWSYFPGKEDELPF